MLEDPLHPPPWSILLWPQNPPRRLTWLKKDYLYSVHEDKQGTHQFVREADINESFAIKITLYYDSPANEFLKWWQNSYAPY